VSCTPPSPPPPPHHPEALGPRHLSCDGVLEIGPRSEADPSTRMPALVVHKAGIDNYKMQIKMRAWSYIIEFLDRCKGYNIILLFRFDRIWSTLG
jgi:hypothetical protein